MTLCKQPWLAQPMFEAVDDTRIIDEWTFCQYQDRDVATGALKNHWDTFITEDDFQEIASAGWVINVLIRSFSV